MAVRKECRDGVTIITLENGKANALDLELLVELGETILALSPPAVKAMVLTGAGRMFCAGVDLHRLLAEGQDYCREFLDALAVCLRSLFLLPIPTVAAINGHAIAGGCILASCCDHKIMDPGPGRIGVTGLLVGVPFPRVAIEILRFTLAPGLLEDLIYSGRLMSATEALSLRLVNEVDKQVLDRSLQVASKLAEIPAATFALTKKQIRGPVQALWEGEPDAARAELEQLWNSPIIRDLIRSYMESMASRKNP